MTEVERILGPKWKEILDAAVHFIAFQYLVGSHRLTGQDISQGVKLLNVTEDVLEEGGAGV